VGAPKTLQLTVHCLASFYHGCLKVAVCHVSPRELFFHELHELGQSVVRLAYLGLDVLQVRREVEGCMLLHRELYVLDVYRGWYGLD
jgi:hypothetical protein